MVSLQSWEDFWRKLSGQVVLGREAGRLGTGLEGRWGLQEAWGEGQHWAGTGHTGQGEGLVTDETGLSPRLLACVGPHVLH